jgi:tetratricopeptide (TPR) repeat protein
MSKKTTNQNTGEPLEGVQEIYTKTEAFFENNKKSFAIGGGVIALLIGGFFAYTKFYKEPREIESSSQIWKSEFYFEKDSLDRAINGDDNYMGLDEIAKSYNGSKSAELANYYMGISYLKKGEYELAINYLEKTSLEDEIVGAMAKGAIGDAYVELGDNEKAISSFEKAVSHSKNILTTPMFLKKLGIVYEEVGKKDKALESYKRIKDDFPTSTEASDIDKYVARVGG